MEPGEFDLVGFAVGVVERDRGAAAATCAPAIASSGSRARACAATATRSPGAALLDRGGRDLDGPAWPARTTRSPRSCCVPSVIYAPAMLRLAARSTCTRSRTSPAAASPTTSSACSPTTATPSSSAGTLGRAAHLLRDPDARATSVTTRWSTCSTSGSACSRSCRATTRCAAVDAARASGHDAWLVGEIVDGRGRVRMTRPRNGERTGASGARGRARASSLSSLVMLFALLGGEVRRRWFPRRRRRRTTTTTSRSRRDVRRRRADARSARCSRRT